MRHRCSDTDGRRLHWRFPNSSRLIGLSLVASEVSWGDRCQCFQRSFLHTRWTRPLHLWGSLIVGFLYFFDALALRTRCPGWLRLPLTWCGSPNQIQRTLGCRASVAHVRRTKLFAQCALHLIRVIWQKSSVFDSRPADKVSPLGSTCRTRHVFWICIQASTWIQISERVACY